MNRKKHTLIYEKVNLTQNLFTTPLDITGLDGDSFDYMVEWVNSPVSIVANAYITFNNDGSSSNYRLYIMRGGGSSPTGYTSDTWDQVFIDLGYGESTSSVGRMFVTGDSGGERYCDINYSNGYSTKRVCKQSSYWKNTADNLTSIQIKGSFNQTYTTTIRIYQIPKQANLDNYDLVEAVDFVSRDLNASPIVFSGLDGDADGEYLVEVEQTVTVGNVNLGMRFNSDSGTNYTEQRLFNNGTIGSANQTISYIQLNAENGERGYRCFATINATSGRKRLVSSSSSDAPRVGGAAQSERAWWYGNTADNITSIELKDSFYSTLQTGSVKLYKRKSNKTIDPVPMETLVEYDIAGVDFSAGITITGLQGDRINGAMKVEFVGTGNNTGNKYLRMQFNGDVSANYPCQKLRAYLSNVEAHPSTNSYVEFGRSDLLFLNKETKVDCYIYPTSGQNRPMLSDIASQYSTGYVVSKDATWWNNTADEITSIKIYATGGTTLTGTIRISVPKGTKMASPSAILTVN